MERASGAAQPGQGGADQGSGEAFFEVVEEASGQNQIEGAVVGGQVGGGAQDVAGGRGGLGAGRGRQVCEGVLEGVGADVVEDQAVSGVQESRVDPAQVGGASGREQQDAAAGGARGPCSGRPPGRSRVRTR
ncbi:hypothetical protein [Streptomyces sp. NRRL S-455]|uniref:hypothetical protein n=1 Tax=Streptomyces sp. NRRL S-455 TaxID=1463908 RepID=UPI0004BFCDEB|nr:hypothetical protein [Streptomyces sp. NRRL S-455]